MIAYVTHIIDTAHKLRGTGFDINEELVGSLLLKDLPIEHMGIDISADVIKTKVMHMCDNVGSNESDSTFITSQGRK